MVRKVIKPTVKSLSLRSRIYLSAGLLVGICCVASGIGWLGQSVLLSNIEDYEHAESLSAQVLEIDRNVQKLKAQSENFIYFGTESKRRAADLLLAKLKSQIEDTQRHNDNRELYNSLEEMTLHLQTFGEQLELAGHERGIRTTIVNEQLLSKANEVQSAIDQLRDTMNESQPGESSTVLIDVVQGFGDGRRHLLRYLIDPNADALENTLAALKRAETQASSVAIADSTKVRKLRESLTTKLDEFRQLALRAVQATRGYLYYSNVVMAGEISEFVYYSDHIKHSVDRQRKLNRASRKTAVNRSQTLSVIAPLAALGFAGLLAAGLSYSILRPISLLTDAFRRLAGGETLEDIPETHRSDEIGRMSQAAQVFSAKNQETQDLLVRSQSLSAELAEKAQALEESNLELDNFAYVASHDLKSPLRGINSLAEWVQEDCGELLPEDSKLHLAQMQGRVQKMDALLTDLLEYARVGRIGQRTESVDLNELVQSIIDMTESGTGVRIRVQTRLPQLQTAIAPLKQVILNLVANAIKYNDKAEQGSIEISCVELDDRLHISVADNGIGIDPRYHERVFQMYQRIAPNGVEGSGMGLAIVKKQVEHFGGSVTLESAENKGSTFTFTWPLKTGSHREIGSEKRDPEPEPEFEFVESMGGV
jgi:signal transduction histidine kinase